MRLFSWFTGLVFAALLSGGIWWLAYDGRLTPTFEGDISIRGDSAGGSRSHMGGGIYGGK